MSRQIVAVKECSAGNASVGNEWLETKVFDKDTSLADVIMWAGDGYLNTKGHRLMLTVPDQQDCLDKK